MKLNMIRINSSSPCLRASVVDNSFKQGNFYLMLLTILSLFSCGIVKNKEDVIINGHLDNAAGKKVVLSELLPEETIEIDSAIISTKGSFSFKLKPESAGFYLLRISGDQKIPLVIDKGETISLSADINMKPVVHNVSGSTGSLLLKEFLSHSELNLERADSLNDILKQNQDKPGFYQMTIAFDPVFKKIMEEQQDFERKFIFAHLNSLTSLIVLNYQLGLKPVLTLKSEPELFLMLDSTLSTRYPQNKNVLFHHQRVMEFKRESQ
jgi:hypothetical protein